MLRDVRSLALLATLALPLFFVFGPHAAEAQEASSMRVCSAGGVATLDDSPVCRLENIKMTEEEVRGALDGKAFSASLEGSVLQLYGRSTEDAYPVRGGIVADLIRLGDSPYWFGAYTLERADEAMLLLMHPSGEAGGPPGFLPLRGPNAPVAPRYADPLEGQISTQVVPSAALNERRRIAVYSPPVPAGTKLDVMVMADGEAIEVVGRLVEPLIKSGSINPLLIVGVFSGPAALEGEPGVPVSDLRPADYLKGFPGALDRHSRFVTFFTAELPAYIRAHHPVNEDRASWTAFGQSDGGALVLQVAVAADQPYGSVLAASPSWHPVTADACEGRASPPKVIMAAGLYETTFRATADANQGVLAACGYDVATTIYVAGHTPDVSNTLLQEALPQIASESVP